MADRAVGKLIEWCYVRGTDIVVVGVLSIGIGLGTWSTQRPIKTDQEGAGEHLGVPYGRSSGRILEPSSGDNAGDDDGIARTLVPARLILGPLRASCRACSSVGRADAAL